MSDSVVDLFARLGLKTDKASFDVADRLIGGVKTALAGIAAFASVKWAASLVRDTTEVASHFVDLSQQVGVGVESLQQLSYAAGLAGVDSDSLGGSLKRLSASVYAAWKGSKEARETFKDLGVAFRDGKGAIRPVEDVLGDVAERFKAMPNGTAKTAEAMKIFGKTGAQLIPFLNAGRSGIAEMRKELVALGGQIDQGSAESLEAFGDETDKVKVALIGLRNQAVIALLPTLREGAGRIIEWIKANRELIAQKVQSFVAGLVEWSKKLWDIAKSLWPVIRTAAEWIARFTEAVGGAGNAVKILALWMVRLNGVNLVGALVMMATKLWGVAAAARASAASMALATAQAKAAQASFDAQGWAPGTAGRPALPDGRAGLGWKGAAASAGLVLGAGMTGYGIGTALDQSLGLSDKIAGVEGDFKDPYQVAFAKKQRAAKAARERAAMAAMLGGDPAAIAAGVGAPPAATIPAGSTSGRRGSASAQAIDARTSIVVNSKAADPKAVAREVAGEFDRQWDEKWKGKMRTGAAGTR